MIDFDDIIGGLIFGLFVLGPLVFIPAALARWLVTSNWRQISCAFAIWGMLLLTVSLEQTSDRNPTLTWVFILAMFFNWMAIPMIALICRVTNTPDWLITRLQSHQNP